MFAIHINLQVYRIEIASRFKTMCMWVYKNLKVLEVSSVHAAGGADLGGIWMFPKAALMFPIYFPYPDFAEASQDAFPGRLAAFQKCLPYLGIIWEAFGKNLWSRQPRPNPS